MAREEVVKVVCDLCKSEIYTNLGKENGWVSMQMPVRYDFYQSDGYPSKPYFSISKVDLCPKCQEKLLKHWPIEGDGALGCKIREWIIHD